MQITPIFDAKTMIIGLLPVENTHYAIASAFIKNVNFVFFLDGWHKPFHFAFITLHMFFAEVKKN